MKKYSLLLIVLFCTVILSQSFGQTAKEERKQEKAEKKAVKFTKDSISNQFYKTLVASQAFVLEANTLYDKSGKSFILNRSTNFVGFEGKNSTIQLAFDQLVGWNGVGGVTLDGTVSTMEVTDNKKGLGFTINVTVMQQVGGVVTMIFRVSADGNARVDMSGSFGERITYQGMIVSLAESTVYKGISRF